MVESHAMAANGNQIGGSDAGMQQVDVDPGVLVDELSVGGDPDETVRPPEGGDAPRPGPEGVGGQTGRAFHEV